MIFEDAKLKKTGFTMGLELFRILFNVEMMLLGTKTIDCVPNRGGFKRDHGENRPSLGLR